MTFQDYLINSASYSQSLSGQKICDTLAYVQCFKMTRCTQYAFTIITANSIPRHTDFHATPQNSLFAAENRGTAHFLLHLYLIQGFWAPFLLLPFIKQNLVAVSLLL